MILAPRGAGFRVLEGHCWMEARMTAWMTRRAGAALPVALCVTLAAACGGDRTAADTTMVMDTTGMVPAPMGGVAGDTAAMSDPQIVAQVSADNAAEIAAGTIAGERATAAEVKSFARKMVDDHQRMQGRLDSLATRLAITAVAAETDTLHDAFEARRQSLRRATAGVGWDRDFMNLQVQMHESTLALLQRAAAAAQNTDLRGALQESVPTVQGHLDQARQILSGLGEATADSGR
jgi:putative membrane protein